MIQKRMLAAACAGLACGFSLFRRRSIFDKEKLPLRQGQNYRTFAKIAKILLKKYF
jgi:lipoprotein